MNFSQFVKDRDEALLSLDKDKIVAYCEKYGVPLGDMNNLDFWAGVHKAILEIRSATDVEKERSYTWLVSHGFHTLGYYSTASKEAQP